MIRSKKQVRDIKEAVNRVISLSRLEYNKLYLSCDEEESTFILAVRYAYTKGRVHNDNT